MVQLHCDAMRFKEGNIRMDVAVVSGKTQQRDIHKHRSNQFQMALASKLRLSLVVR